jgi:peptidoglycan/xylan/chitin deacetylase (PgdA/CDA1 family)
MIKTMNINTCHPGRIFAACMITIMFVAGITACQPGNIGQTEIAKWQDGKKGAVSLTWDDGTINQFRVAVPIMDNLGFPATFFINTGEIIGSRYHGTFIGRPVKEIIKETSSVPTGKENFLERSSAARFLGYRGTASYHTRAGEHFDAGRHEDAFEIMDDLYERVRKGEFQAVVPGDGRTGTFNRVSWDEIRSFAANGHEFGSHMVTHPRLAALDDANALYELEKSREEILDQLGPMHTFSAQVPYGTENDRAVQFAHNIYPALRNRMPEPFLTEINRWNRTNPGSADSEYVQWQREPRTATPLPLMKSWADTTAAHDNVWLVLVFHGVDGIGWEAVPGELLQEYFQYIKSMEDDLWVATFGDVTRYMRQRMNSTLRSAPRGRNIRVSLDHSLDTSMYNIPMTLKTRIPENWDEVLVRQDSSEMRILPRKDEKGQYVLYTAVPNKGVIRLSLSR